MNDLRSILSRSVFVSALLAVPGLACLAQNAAPSAAVKRGEYLVAIASCGDCHTPLKMGPKGPEPDQSKLLSGHPEAVKLPPPPKLGAGWMYAGAATNSAFAGPWGTSYAFNLTPDVETGLGKWTEQQFIAALRTGKHLGIGRPIMPPMPWPSVAQMTDADLKAIWAYLRSLPAIQNRVPEVLPPASPQPSR